MSGGALAGKGRKGGRGCDAAEARQAGKTAKREDLAGKVAARRAVLIGLAVFTAILAGILAVYWGRDGEFYLTYSISRYVGREAWSAIVFWGGNMILAGCIVWYMRAVWRDYGKVWLGMMVVMVGCFVGLSFCPIGLFDARYGDFGVVSMLHQVFSRGMFMAMAGAAAVMGARRRGAWFLGMCGAYVLYAVVCAVMSMTTQVFWDYCFIFETAYIYWFYGILGV